MEARIGLGGMSSVPLLAKHSQSKLLNSKFNEVSFKNAAQVLPKDVTPLSDVRASREYRMHVIQRLIIQSGKELFNQIKHNTNHAMSISQIYKE